MKIEVEQLGKEAVINLSGKLDVDTSPDLRRTALSLYINRRCKRLTIDFSKIFFIDTSGLATLLEILLAGKEQCAGLTLTGLNARVRYLIEVNGLTGFFKIDSQFRKN